MTELDVDELDFFPPRTASDFHELHSYTQYEIRIIHRIEETISGYVVSGRINDGGETATGTVLETYFNFGGTRAIKIRTDDGDEHFFEMDRVTEVHQTN